MQNAAIAGAAPGADGQNDTHQSGVSSLAGHDGASPGWISWRAAYQIAKPDHQG
jgi:hypothetical protein